MDVDISNSFYDAHGSDRCDDYYLQNINQACIIAGGASIDAYLTATPSIDSAGVITVQLEGMDSVTSNYGQVI